jgi:uncharacterized protein YecE (DUF72 family)
MARPHIGLPLLRGTLERYAERYDLLEIHLDDSPPPKPATLRGFRKKVPPSFVFSVVVPRAAAELKPSSELDAAVAQTLAVGQAVEARCILIATPPHITPTDTNRKRLAALVSKIPHDAVTLAWEPHGLWEIEEAIRVAKKLDIVLVVDPVRDPAPPGPVAYFRLRGLGESSRLSPAALEKVGAELSSRREAYVIVECTGPAAVADALAKRVSRRIAPLKGPSVVLRPRTTLRAEDEEQ